MQLVRARLASTSARKSMGNVFGIGAHGVEAGGLFAQAQAAAMTGGSVAAVFAPLVTAVAAVGVALTLVLSGMLLK